MLSSCCVALPYVLYVCLQFVIVVFPNGTHLICVTVGFLLLRYSVVYTVEFLSLVYLDLYLQGDDKSIS